MTSKRLSIEEQIEKKEEIIKQCLSLIDGFDGSDIEYLELLHELTDECEIRIEGKEMELGKK